MVASRAAAFKDRLGPHIHPSLCVTLGKLELLTSWVHPIGWFTTAWASLPGTRASQMGLDWHQLLHANPSKGANWGQLFLLKSDMKLSNPENNLLALPYRSSAMIQISKQLRNIPDQPTFEAAQKCLITLLWHPRVPRSALDRTI